MDSLECNAAIATRKGWSRLAVPTVGALGERRGFCPSCGARRMAESAALLVDEVLPHQPMRQWVLSFPYQLRFLFASRPELMGNVLGIVYRAIASYLIKKAGLTRKSAQCGAVTLIQRFGSALNLNLHFHMLFLDGVYAKNKLERLCRYISRPAVSEKRLSLTSTGNIRYQLKTPYSDGTTHVAALAHPCASRHSCIHAHHIRSPGLHRKAGLSCAKAEGQPHKISRCIRRSAASSKQQAPDSGDSCQAGQRRTKSYWTGQNTRRTTVGHDLHPRA